MRAFLLLFLIFPVLELFVFVKVSAAIGFFPALLLIIAGSSLAVNTGVRLVHRAEARGIPIAVINRGPTAVDRRPSLHTRIEGGTSETLSALAAALPGGRQTGV